MNVLQLLNETGVLNNNKFHNKSQQMVTPNILNLLTEQTSFLHVSASIRDRVFSLQLNLTSQPTCSTCSAPVFPSLRNAKLVVPLYCSRKCTNNFISRDKRKKTIKEKYNVNHPYELPEFVAKRIRTVQQRYGVDTIAHSPEVRQQIEQTNLARYGAKNPQQNAQINAKTKITNKERYGSDCSLTNEAVKMKTKKTNLKKYGVEHPMQNSEVFENMKQTMLDEYGAEFFNQQHISHDVLAKLNDKQFLEEQHYTLKKTQTQIAELLQISQSVVSRYFKKHSIETKHFFRSVGEQELADFLQSLNLEVVCNTRAVIHPQELDVYIPELQLALEYNGSYWHSEQNGRGEHYHNEKTIACLNKGIILLHIDEELWKESKSLVKETIIKAVADLKALI